MKAGFDFLNAMVTAGIRDGVADIFGDGIEPDESIAVQRARMAKALLDRLEEYQLQAQEQTVQTENRNEREAVENHAEKKTEAQETRISIREKYIN